MTHETTIDTPLPSVYPVIMTVPESSRQLAGRAKVDVLSRLAREALSLSGRKSGWSVVHLKKDAKGAPIPENGIHWSLSHKSRFVAAVTAPYPIGIDIEKIRPGNELLHRRVACRQEWRLGAGIEPDLLFLRYWTAKEAVLKAVGVGLKGLSHCRVTKITSTHRLSLTYNGQPFEVLQTQFDDHLSAITTNHYPICWHTF